MKRVTTTWGHTHQECVPQHPCHVRGMGAVMMGVAANEVNGGDKGWGWLQTRLAGAMTDGGGCKRG